MGDMLIRKTLENHFDLSYVLFFTIQMKKNNLVKLSKWIHEFSKFITPLLKTECRHLKHDFLKWMWFYI